MTSRLDYANGTLYGIYIKKLQLVQNSAARLITKSYRREHITPILKQLHWLPIEQRIRFKILVTCYKCLNGLAPVYLSELIVPYMPSRSLRSCDSLLLEVPKTKTSFGDRRFGVCAPREWNNLPISIRQSNTVILFKSSLKAYVFREYYL